MALAFLNLHFLIYTGSHCDVLVTRQEVQLQDYPHSGKEEVECMVFPGHLGREYTHIHCITNNMNSLSACEASTTIIHITLGKLMQLCETTFMQHTNTCCTYTRLLYLLAV